jgi:protein-disulfide isomerase
VQKKSALRAVGVVVISLCLALQAVAQEDRIAKVAIDTLRAQSRLPREMEIRFLEKQESPIPEFYGVKLLLVFPDRDVPVVVYVDRGGEKVILGNLFIKGDNVTRKEAGDPKPRKYDMAQLEIDKSPFRGSPGAKATVVEFSNFQCPYCLRSWGKMKELIEKRPQDIKYVFKHFPLQSQGKIFDISVMAAAALEVSSEAFWNVHDFFFSEEGQNVLKGEKDAIRLRIEKLLQDKKADVKVFQAALENGKARVRVERDMTLGQKFNVRGTPTTLLNGDLVKAPFSEQVLDQYVNK